VLQQQETDHVERLEDVGQMRRHTEDEDLVFKAVVLEILVEMALVATQNE
jgi:hypothetical protein